MAKSCKAFQECCLYFTANSLTRHISKLADDAFKITGLSPSHGHVMLLLIDQPGLSQNEISKHMNLKPSTMTRFIDKLLYMGYVERVQEGRSVFIHPTQKGKELKPLIDKALGNLFNQYCELLGKDFAVKLTQDIQKANLILDK